MKISNPDAPADNKSIDVHISEDGSIEITLLDDSRTSYSKVIIERLGINIIKVLINGNRAWWRF